MEKTNQAHGEAHTQWLIRENKHAEEGQTFFGMLV